MTETVPKQIDDIIARSYHPEYYSAFLDRVKDLGITLVDGPHAGTDKPNLDSGRVPAEWFNCLRYVFLTRFGKDVRTHDFPEVNAMFDQSATFLGWNDASIAKPGDVVIYTNPALLDERARTYSKQVYLSSGRHHWGVLRDNNKVESK
jgi:hypothetical protein